MDGGDFESMDISVVPFLTRSMAGVRSESLPHEGPSPASGPNPDHHRVRPDEVLDVAVAEPVSAIQAWQSAPV
jgi:hypothetical protein